jgi:hypothetical protein
LSTITTVSSSGVLNFLNQSSCSCSDGQYFKSLIMDIVI